MFGTMLSASELIDQKEKEVATARSAVDAARASLEIKLKQLELAEAELAGMKAIFEATVGSTKSKKYKQTRKRALGDDWQAVLKKLAELYPSSANYEKLQEICDDVGITANRNTLRSQMSLYRTKGYVRSETPGWFIITLEGAKAAATMLPNTNGSINEIEPLDEIDELVGRAPGDQPSTPSDLTPVQAHQPFSDDGLDDDIPF